MCCRSCKLQAKENAYSSVTYLLEYMGYIAIIIKCIQIYTIKNILS